MSADKLIPVSSRRTFVASALSASQLDNRHPLTPIVIRVHLMFDQGAHSGKGLTEGERAKFYSYQEKARHNFLTSGIVFSVTAIEGAYLRQQGRSLIPDHFLARGKINLFVTDNLGYDIDRDRTGGCSIGPGPRRPKFAPSPFYQTFIGLSNAHETTLSHEYAHHFTLDTNQDTWLLGNFWVDLRNDYWLWRQRHGASIAGFRACMNSEWAKVGETATQARATSSYTENLAP